MKLNVLYQFNEKYVPFAGVSITSLLENNREIKELIIHALVESISQPSKDKLQRMCEKYGRQIIFYDTKDLVKYMEQLGIPQYRNSYATNFKMFFPEYVDKDEERILYIDSDTIIFSSVADLMQVDMHGYPIAMVLDSLARRHKLQLGHSKHESYYNAGVILFDLSKWREGRYTEKIIEHVQNVRAHYFAPDQDLINIVCKNNICTLDLEYNFQPIHAISTYSQHKILFAQKIYYSNQEVERVYKSPKIIHFFRFLGEFPWNDKNLHPFRKYFDYYLDISEWSDYIKRPPLKNQLVFRIEKNLYRFLPRFMFLLLFKLNYEFFIWKANLDSLNNKNNEKM